MRTKKAFLSTVAGISNQIIKATLLFVVRKMMIKYIGASQLGLTSLFSNIVSVFSLTDLGISTSVALALYKPLAEENWNECKKYYMLLKYFYTIMIVIIGIGGICLFPIVILFINGNYTINEIIISYCLYLIGTLSSYFGAYNGTLLTADQKNYVVSIIKSICTIIFNITQVVIIVVTRNFYFYLFVIALFNLTVNLLLREYVRHNYYWTKGPKVHIDRKELNDFCNKTKDILIYKVSKYLIHSGDNLIISKMLGTIIIAYYGNYYLIISIMHGIVANFAESTIAGIGNLFVNEKNKICEKAKMLLVIQNILYSVTAITMYVLIDEFVVYFFGKESYCSEYLSLALVIMYYLMGLQSCLECFREGGGAYGDKYVQVVVSIINVFLSILFTKLIGVTGVVIGTIFCFGLKAYILNPREIFKFEIELEYKNEYRAYLVYFSFVFLIALGLSNCLFFVKIESFWISFVIKGLLASVSTLCIEFVFLKRTNIYKEFLKYGKSIVKQVICKK